MPAGPCMFCGAMNYPTSLGSPWVCPSCDCGNPPKRGPDVVVRHYSDAPSCVLTMPAVGAAIVSFNADRWPQWNVYPSSTTMTVKITAAEFRRLYMAEVDG